MPSLPFRKYKNAVSFAALLVVVGFVSFIGASRMDSGSAAVTWPITASQCLARSDIVRKTGVDTTNLIVKRPNDSQTYDLRGWVNKAYGTNNLPYPLSLGVENVSVDDPSDPTLTPNFPGFGTCVIGGAIMGQQPRNLSWQAVKRDTNPTYDGDAVQVNGDAWSYIDGVRIDNVEDGITPYSNLYTTTQYVRNVYATYIRDDCIENDWPVLPMVVENSLFDGCYMGISERPNPVVTTVPPSTSKVIFNNVLMRIQPQPWEDGTLQSAQIFKLGPHQNRFELNNVIFWVEKVSNAGANAMVFPKNVIINNVTIVWTGAGDYPGAVPAGVRVTKDRSVWDVAKANWLQAHGCPSGGDTTGTSCARMIPELTSAPLPGSDTAAPTVSVTATPASAAPGTTIFLEAAATDNVGVTKVEFYVDNTLIHTEGLAPYNHNWLTAGLAAGAKTLTAKAYDAAGNVKTSAPFTITLGTPTNSGDANNDARVNALDLSILLSKDGQAYVPADFNGDGIVGAADMAILLGKWTW